MLLWLIAGTVFRFRYRAAFENVHTPITAFNKLAVPMVITCVT